MLEFDLLQGCYGGRPGMSGRLPFIPAADYCRPPLVAP
jgi:hypothetical protein